MKSGIVDTSSNKIWENADNYDDWETSRLLLFRDDMRDMFFRWFRIKTIRPGARWRVCNRSVNPFYCPRTYDAVLNHVYLGVLSDSMAGLRDLIRVCKVGGNISVSVSSRSFSKLKWDGDSPFTGESRLNELIEKQEQIYKKITTAVVLKQDHYWHGMRYPRMFAQSGLHNITIHPYVSGFSYKV